MYLTPSLVGTLIHLINKEKDPHLALLAYRSTSLTNAFRNVNVKETSDNRTDI